MRGEKNERICAHTRALAPFSTTTWSLGRALAPKGTTPIGAFRRAIGHIPQKGVPMPFRCSPSIPNVFDIISERPWELAVPPFQVAPRTYYVSGQRWVGSYLIDARDGCILVDTGALESCPLLVESVHELGYSLRDIRLILISHAHVDHCGAAGMLAHLTGADVLMSCEDEGFMRASPGETLDIDPRLRAQPFEVSGHFSDDEPVTLGDVAIRTLLTSGHTCGCTSYFWDVENPADGERYTLGMHGGVGVNTMNDKYYAKSAYLTLALREVMGSGGPPR